MTIAADATTTATTATTTTTDPRHAHRSLTSIDPLRPHLQPRLFGHLMLMPIRCL
jgi:hypothetical protein